MINKMLTHKHNRRQIHRHNPIPQLNLTRPHGVELIRNPRIIHQHIHLAEPLKRSEEDTFDAVFGCDVRVEGEDALFGYIERGNGRVETGRVDVDHDHLGALREEGFGDVEAEAAAGTGYEDDSVLECHFFGIWILRVLQDLESKSEGIVVRKKGSRGAVYLYDFQKREITRLASDLHLFSCRLFFWQCHTIDPHVTRC